MPCRTGRGRAVLEPFFQQTRTGLPGGADTSARGLWDPDRPWRALGFARVCLNSGRGGVGIWGTELGSGDPASVRRPREGNREMGVRGSAPGRPLWPPQCCEGPRAGPAAQALGDRDSSTSLQEAKAVRGPHLHARHPRRLRWGPLSPCGSRVLPRRGACLPGRAGGGSAAAPAGGHGHHPGLAQPTLASLPGRAAETSCCPTGEWALLAVPWALAPRTSWNRDSRGSLVVRGAPGSPGVAPPPVSLPDRRHRRQTSMCVTLAHGVCLVQQLPVLTNSG